ncbi:glycosyltransferase [Halanaerobacter jeridensis]|uniref:Glycosyltransferase involved in cell wall biosynthesis n=1 Tax=Halanaerobacter jeridensis TaxID=706427 RepID=A0A938XS44_9FIRM|nr:glycosyltransferase involved in cell wall biosynthesis [Halanaerobacter jeridensis]
MGVSVLIPAFNEEERIKLTIETVFKLNEVQEVIVIDDGSTDSTYQQALQTKAKVLQLTVNQGKGAALNFGLKEVEEDTILLLDADVGVTAIEAQKLITPVIKREADMTVAKFPKVTNQGGFGLVKKLATWGLKIITGQEFTAPLSGQRAVNSRIIKEINNFAPGFAVEVALTIATWQAGFKIKEIAVDMCHRVTGRNLKGFYHRGQQFKDIAVVLVSALRE